MYKSGGRDFIITESDLFIVYNPTAVWFNRFRTMYIILLYDCYYSAVYVNLFAQIAVQNISILRYPYTRDITIYYTYRNMYRPTRVCVQNIFPTRVQTIVLYYIIITLYAFEILPLGRFSYHYDVCVKPNR